MEKSLDDAITELYSELLVQRAFSKILLQMLLGYVETVDKVKSEALAKVFQERFDYVTKQEMLSSQFRDEYVDKVAKDFLKGIEGIDLPL